jgi:hypothetical protein
MGVVMRAPTGDARALALLRVRGDDLFGEPMQSGVVVRDAGQTDDEIVDPGPRESPDMGIDLAR